MEFKYQTKSGPVIVPNTTGAYMMTAWRHEDGSVFFTRTHIVAWRIVDDNQAEPVCPYNEENDGSNRIESVIVNGNIITEADYGGGTYDNLESFIRGVCAPAGVETKE